jgi:tRNA (guanine9-N1)-methyltransferase
MADLEERPSKIRKLDPTNDKNGDQDEITLPGFEGLTGELDEDASRRESEVSTPALGGNHEKLLSKSQLKKIRKQKEWEAGREYRKAKRKEKEREKKARKSSDRVEVEKENDKTAALAPAPTNRSHQRSILVPVTLVLDCDFDELMTDKEIISLASQLTRCYSSNKGAPYKAHLAVSSFGGQLKQRFETVLANHHLGWKGVKFTNDDFVAAAEAANVAMRDAAGGKLAGALAGSASTVTTSLQQPEARFSEPLGGVDDNMSEQNTPEQEEQLHGESSMLPKPTPSKSTNSDGMSFDAKNIEAENGTQALEVPSLISSHGGLSAANSIGSRLPEIIEGESIRKANLPPQEPASTDSTNVQPHGASTEICLSGHENDEKGEPVLPNPSIIYLTSDSPNTLDVLLPYTSYIIGGLVDKNRHKGICYKRACARNIPTAKLPIGEYMTMQSRSVLATNHVAEIMVRWLEHGDWARAFLEVIPKRKEAKLKIGTCHRNKQGDEETADALAGHGDVDAELEQMREGDEEIAG